MPDKRPKRAQGLWLVYFLTFGPCKATAVGETHHEVMGIVE